MKITIITSMRFGEKAREIEKSLIELGHKVKIPRDAMKDIKKMNILDNDSYTRIHEYFIRSWLITAIPWADVILLVNKAKPKDLSYFGINTSMELGVSLYLEKPVVTLYEYDREKNEELVALKIPTIDGDLTKIEEVLK